MAGGWRKRHKPIREGDCLIWDGAVRDRKNGDLTPTLPTLLPDGGKKMFNPVHMAFEAAWGVDLSKSPDPGNKSGKIQVRNLCGRQDCVQPMHYAPKPYSIGLGTRRAKGVNVPAAVRKSLRGHILAETAPGGAGGIVCTPGELRITKEAVERICALVGLQPIHVLAVYGQIVVEEATRSKGSG